MGAEAERRSMVRSQAMSLMERLTFFIWSGRKPRNRSKELQDEKEQEKEEVFLYLKSKYIIKQPVWSGLRTGLKIQMTG